MSIRDEFEKALAKEYPITIMEGISVTTKGTNLIALWAAKWMAEKYKKECGRGRELSYESIAEIAKDLDA